MTDRESQLADAASALADDVDSPETPEESDDSFATETTVSTGALAVLDPPAPGVASVAPDGSRIAFMQRDTSGTLRLWIADLDGTEPRVVDTSFDLIDDPDGPQWSSDGEWLALVAPHPADGRSAIYLLNIETGAARLLVDHPGADRSPRWSPSDDLIAFVSRRDGRDAICAAWVDGSASAVQLTHAFPGQDDHDPCWSHDGIRIGFARRTIENDQVGDHIWTVNIQTGESKQITKRLAMRRQLSWSPDRALIIHISDDGDWENVSVVNPDNSAGWNIASEAGDKNDPHYTHDGQRVTYTRLKDGVVRVCERAASSSGAETIDPGNGFAYSPRFLPDKRVLYAYAGATGAPHFYIQEPKADAERTQIPAVVSWSSGRNLVTPAHHEVEINNRKAGGLMYLPAELSGPAPLVIYLGERPDQPRVAKYDGMIQAVVSAGLAVFAPTLPGSPGYNKRVAGALKDLAGTEAEVSDLLTFRDAVITTEGVDRGRVAVVGSGHGGTLALLLAGSRPGQVQAVVAIDPIADWDMEFDEADASFRSWMVRTFGLPANARGAYALRTPSTFAGVIDAATLIIGSDHVSAGRAAQLDALTGDMRELELDFEQDVSNTETAWDIGMKVAAFLRTSFSAIRGSNDDRVDAGLDASAV